MKRSAAKRPGQRIGLDIGGANLKAATDAGDAADVFFPLWKQPDRLAAAVAKILQGFYGDAPADCTIGVTMTGELADCYVDRAVGVAHITESVVQAAERIGVNRQRVHFYCVDGRFVDSQLVKQRVDQAAASNWHALASYVAAKVCSDGWLIDIGSTTCDLIPLRNGRVATDSHTDFDRLCKGQLAYLGCRRTPVQSIVCSLLMPQALQTGIATVSNDAMHCDGDLIDVPVMREQFATLDDVGLLLGHVPEDQEDCDTADGCPRTISSAINRIARMVGLDRRSVDLGLAQFMARQVKQAASDRIRDAASRAVSDQDSRGDTATNGTTLVISGHGDWLMPDDLDVVLRGDGHVGDRLSLIRLAEHWGPAISRVAPAYAVARLMPADDHYEPS
ncbi:Hydantoinase/oxoprolinase [Crateriforma conspicua]|uniref:Hydantoinase/oxoprolinase n=1 Tax=Crateriforma conspicua TaxID=2527996 RepID=A0A5C6FV50_9PLAN|nr:hydantoinase/oxoprolinase family protein [Crateriforma conspicua]TWU66174.1 Hydantoinase/oxoprolinase [Crateriforma conspicua]